MRIHSIFKHSIVVLLMLITFSACNKKAAVTNVVSYENLKAKDVVKVMDTLFVDFDELKARFKVKANLNGKSRSFNADLRWENDEQMWFSFSIFGIEGIRALFTRDSVHIINKLEKQYIYGTYEHLTQLSQVPLTFDEIEDLFLGKLTGVQDNKPNVRLGKNEIILDLSDKDYKAQAAIDPKALSIQHFLITSLIGSRSVDVTLSNYRLINNKNWANDRLYKIKSGANYLNIDAKTQKVVLNEKLEYPFYINENYKRIPLQNYR